MNKAVAIAIHPCHVVIKKGEKFLKPVYINYTRAK